ncbi:MAG: hypothetical protein P8048_01650 [Calditrichia bacterium]
MNTKNDKNESLEYHRLLLNLHIDNFKSIAKSQARSMWVIVVLISFSLLITNTHGSNLNIPFFNLPISVHILHIIMPPLLSFILWQFMGSLRALNHSVKNIEFRMRKIYCDNLDLRIGDIDTSVNPVDFITYNMKEYLEPGTEEKIKYNWRHFPYALFILLFLVIKIWISTMYTVATYYKVFFAFLIILDFIVCFSLFKKRISLFIMGRE